MKGKQTLSLSPSGGENVASHRCLIAQLKHIFERLAFKPCLSSVKVDAHHTTAAFTQRPPIKIGGKTYGLKFHYSQNMKIEDYPGCLFL